jgi:hypothetical protein
MTVFHSLSGRLTISVVATFLLAANCQSIAAELATAGWVEKAVIIPQDIIIHAKLDTGAETSSINAPDPDYFERDGKQWVRFRVTNRDIESVMVEEPIVREARIKRHFGGKQTRPVIDLRICVGDVVKKVEVNLVDRTGLNYQLLIGRNYLKDTYLVNSSSTYTLSPDCGD